MNESKDNVTIILDGKEVDIPKADLKWFEEERGAKVKGAKEKK